MKLVTLLNSKTNLLETYQEVCSWFDGSAMDFSKVDGEVYRRKNSKYFMKVLDFTNQDYLIKNTLQDVRLMTATEILLIKMKFYKGVQLNGYYSANDTPKPIFYTISVEEIEDNSGDKLVISDLQLITIFQNEIDLAYFGVLSGLDNMEYRINDVIEILQNYPNKEIKLTGSYAINPNVGIRLKDEKIYNFSSSQIFSKANNSLGYELISLSGTNGVTLLCGNVYGDKYVHYIEGFQTVDIFEIDVSYRLTQILYLHHYGLKCVKSGHVGSFRPYYNYNTLVLGQIITIGDADFEVIHLNLGEWGHCVSCYGSTNFKIIGGLISYAWGDGIYIGTGSKNGLIENVTCAYNRRQGLSIVSAENIKVINSTFNNTMGTLPEAGIDIEPNDFDTIKNILISNCTTNNNYSYGLLMTTFDNTSLVEDIVVNNLESCHNLGVGIQIETSTAYRDSLRNVSVNNAIVNNNRGVAVRVGASVGVSVNNCSIDSKTSYYNAVELRIAKRLNFSNNRIYSATVGVNVQEDIDSPSFSFNEITSNDDCIRAYNGDVVKSKMTINNNVFHSDNGTPLKLAKLFDSKIIGNTFIIGKDGILVNEFSRLNIVDNSFQLIGSVGSGNAHIKLIGGDYQNSVRCVGNMFVNSGSNNSKGVIALSPNLKNCEFSNYHFNSTGMFPSDDIFSDSSIKINNI